MSTFVTIGNATQPFNRLLEAVESISSSLPGPIIVQHGATPFNSTKCVVKKYISMQEFEDLIRQSELLIIHGGAGSVIHAIRAGKVPVVMPRLSSFGEHIDDHQLEFACELARTDKIVLALSPENLKDSVEKAIIKMHNKPTYEISKMQQLVGEVIKNKNNY